MGGLFSRQTDACTAAPDSTRQSADPPVERPRLDLGASPSADLPVERQSVDADGVSAKQKSAISVNQIDVSGSHFNSNMDQRNTFVSKDNPYVKQDNVTLSEDNGSVSQHNGSVSRDNGSVSEDNGSVTQDNGSVTKDNGSGSQENGSVTHDNGSVTKGNGSGIQDNGSVRQDNGALSQDNAFVKQYSIYMKQDSTSMKQDNTSMKQDNTFTKQNNTSMKQDNTSMITPPTPRFNDETFNRDQRLSPAASAALTDGTPNICDLSDMNRPTKIGERFSELYDNQWANAFDELTTVQQRTDEEAIELLLNTLLDMYRVCEETAKEQMERLTEALEGFTGETQPLSKDQMESLKSLRKANYKEQLKDLKKKVRPSIRQRLPSKAQRPGLLQDFFGEALELCILMCVQDPMLVLEVAQPDEPFNRNTFSAYLQRGKFVEFCVWPALLLMADGPVLCKGVARGKKEPA